MRDYQIRGLNWMISLYENGINGILADEMVGVLSFFNRNFHRSLRFVLGSRQNSSNHFIVRLHEILSKWRCSTFSHFTEIDFTELDE